jgi:hypothetical protein
LCYNAGELEKKRVDIWERKKKGVKLWV